MAATPAASMTVAKVLVEVVGAACAALCAGIWPNADFEVVVFIMISLILILFALAIQIYKTMARIIGFLPMRLNFIFMIFIIHNGDISELLA